MASQAAYVVEKAVGHGDNSVTKQDVSSYEQSEAGPTMKALVWMAKNKVEIGLHELALPKQCP